MSSKAATIVISERSVLAEGVVAILRNGGYDVFEHVEEASYINLAHLDGTRDILLVLVRERTNDLEGTYQQIGILRQTSPRSFIILVSSDHASLSPDKAFLSEADAFISGLLSGEELLASLTLALSSPNKTFFASCAKSRVYAEAKSIDRLPSKQNDDKSVLGKLSKREQEILYALAKGNSNKHLARLFNLSEATVKAHVRSIFTKLGANNRTTAALHLVSSRELTQRS